MTRRVSCGLTVRRRCKLTIRTSLPIGCSQGGTYGNDHDMLWLSMSTLLIVLILLLLLGGGGGFYYGGPMVGGGIGGVLLVVLIVYLVLGNRS
jgi:hypothetical protein